MTLAHYVDSLYFALHADTSGGKPLLWGGVTQKWLSRHKIQLSDQLLDKYVVYLMVNCVLRRLWDKSHRPIVMYRKRESNVIRDGRRRKGRAAVSPLRKIHVLVHICTSLKTVCLALNLLCLCSKPGRSGISLYGYIG